ncbi:MAG: hypothetical protein ACTSX1_02795 [Candidatus Heimdallarchaeaceae archaeon]
MSLKLGKQFDRNYNMRISFQRGFYDIGIFYNKQSTFLLFSVDQNSRGDGSGAKINMFKNLESSKFCETFLELHNYRKNTLDILNQFKCIKPEYYHEISFVFNETINLSKIDIDDKILFDCLNIYGFTLSSYINEFIFILTERQNIAKRFGKKIVRTSGLQIATSQSLDMLNDYHLESRVSGKAGLEYKTPTSDIIKLEDISDERDNS